MKKREWKDKAFHLGITNNKVCAQNEALQNQLRGTEINHARQVRKLEAKLRKQKAEYELTILRNKKFSDSAINALTNRINELECGIKCNLDITALIVSESLKRDSEMKKRIKELEVENLSMFEELQYLRETPKEFDTEKITLGESLLGLESEPVSIFVFKGIEIPKEIYHEHSKEIQSLIYTLEHCKSDRKRFEYKIEFNPFIITYSVIYFKKTILFSSTYENISIEIEKLTTLFLSEKVREKLLNLMFIKNKYLCSWAFTRSDGWTDIMQYKEGLMFLSKDNRYFSTISELEAILIDKNISL